ncbi:MAG: tetratricopeptide repeat protein, partial [Deinococcota bacterium]
VTDDPVTDDPVTDDPVTDDAAETDELTPEVVPETPSASDASDAPTSADDVITDRAVDDAVPEVDVIPGLITSPDAWPAILSDEARALLAQAETTAARAYTTYDTHTPDRPLWRETLQLARRARELAPDRTEPVRFLAEIYLITEWYFRSWETWLEYIDLGGELDSSALTQLSIAGKNIGYLSYQQENLDRAELFFGEVYELNPEDTEALMWLGRLNFEQADPEAALPFWEEAVQRDLRSPQAQTAVYFLQRTQSQLIYGVDASNAFYDGFEAYERSNLESALTSFVRAINLNDAYRPALQLAGQVNLEQGNLAQARRFYRQAAAIDALEDEPRYFRAEDVDASLYGEDAITAFQAGVRAFEANNLSAARREFARATALSSGYAAAWLWRGYAEFEQGNLQATVNAFGQVARLEPTNASFNTVLGQAQAQLAAIAAAQAAQARASVIAAAPANPVNGVTPTRDPNIINVPSLPSGGPVVLLDVTYTHNGNFDLDTGVSTGTRAFTFLEVPGQVPNNLAFPVNYAAGTLYQRLEVRSKPSGFPVRYQHCLLQSELAFRGDNLSSVSACSDANGLTFTGPGVYEHVQPLSALARAGSFNWQQRIGRQVLILKDQQGLPIDNRYGFDGRWYASPIFSLYYPMQIRYTAVLVPAGGQFIGWP